MSKPSVKDVEVERLARERIVLHHQLKSDLTASALDESMLIYSKHFGYGSALVFMNKVLAEIWNTKTS